MQTRQADDRAVATYASPRRTPPTDPLAREAARLAALADLDAVRPDADSILQELVDSARALFDTALCLVTLITADAQYFRVWSGDLPTDLVHARHMPREHSMCRHVVAQGTALTVADLGADDRFREEAAFRHFGLRFYVGTPLVTSDGHILGSLCLLDPAPRAFEAGQLATLAAFAHAAVGRLETLAALGRERVAGRHKDTLLAALQAANQGDALRHATELDRTLALAHDLIAIIGFDGVIRRINPACTAILGYAPRDLIGRSALDLIHPDDRAATAAVVGATVVGFTNRYLHRDGAIVWLEWQAEAVPGEGVMYCVARDVTARKAAEAALADALRDRERVMDAVPDIIYRLDLDARLVSWNRRMEGVTGYTPAELRDRPALAFFPPDEQPRIAAAIGEAFAQGRVEVEARFQRKDGTLIPYQWTSATVRDEAGVVIGLTGVGRDIAARIAAETALAASEARNAALLDATPDMLLRLGRDGVYRDFRSPSDRATSSARDLYLGYHLRERHTPEFADLMLRQIAATLDTGAMQVFEYSLDTPNGRAEFEARLVPSGPDEVLGVVRNITEKKRTEDALRASEARARAVVDTAYDAIVTMAGDGTIRSFNPAAERVFGYPAAAVIGQPLTLLMPAPFHDAHTRGTRRFLATGRPHILGKTLELEGRRADGTVFPLELAVTAVHGEGETFFTGIMRDVGERRALAARLEHQAFHDALTGLPNRARFLDRLAAALARGGNVAVLLLDLDRFKVVNDSLGHAIGDELLVAVVGRLRVALRPPGISLPPPGVVARLGGDEFAILLEAVGDVREAGQVADRLLHTLATPFALAGREFMIGASIGIVLARPDDGAPPTWPSTARRTRGKATTPFSTPVCRPPRAPSWRWRPSCDERSPARSFSCTTSRRSISPRVGWSASRRWCAGPTRPVGWCRRTTSSRSPRRLA